MQKETLTVNYRDYRGSHQVLVSGTHQSSYEFKIADKHLALATLNWSPYISQSICKHGWIFQSVVALLHRIGYGATITYYPWSRAVSMTESGKADLLFPEYFIEPEAPSDVFLGTQRKDHITLSESIGWGPIAFISRKDYNTEHYKGQLSNLNNERIGVVRGYQNTPEFDRLMDQGSFQIVAAKDDLTNVELLINNRVNLIIGDPEVIKSEIKNSDKSAAEKKQMLGAIKVIDPIIKMNALFLAISKRSQHYESLVIELNKAIIEFKNHGVFSEIKYLTQSKCTND
ncbi:substrate-binding periplasmic protein [Pseudoalteromonas sp.]|uniref:substrate-binding periplasmic protein n=1 Tax=Pseudoalteromonas sp. TaxID=53249 RepID=UPI003564853D